jgi:hypothetical protein
MKYPIVVLEGDDVTMFETPAGLTYLEAIDVRAVEYEALDSAGYPLDLEVDLVGRVIVVDRAGSIPEPERLAHILRRYLAFLAAHPRRLLAAEPPDSASLAELIEAALPFAVEPRWPTPRRPVFSWQKRRKKDH